MYTMKMHARVHHPASVKKIATRKKPDAINQKNAQMNFSDI